MRFVLFSTACFLFLGLSPIATIAQIIPDESLGNERSRLTTEGDRQVISGGATRGGNLFHSFQDFNIGSNQRVYFSSSEGVDRILTRVTGNSPSSIQGTLGIIGHADLFLLNPNGILLGENARSDVKGSFLATTAAGILFDNYGFNAATPTAPPLLNLRVPVGLQWGANPGAIIHQAAEFAVDSGQNLALLGGNLILANGNLTAPQGTLHLGSVAGAGIVGFAEPTWAFDYGTIANLGEMHFSGTASVSASGESGGQIQVRGGLVALRDRASLRADTLGNRDGGGIDIQAEVFRLHDRSVVGATTYGAGAGGAINLRADRVDLRGTDFEIMQQNYLAVVLGFPVNVTNQVSGIFTGSDGAGNSGNITLTTQRLRMQQGAIITSPAFGTGRGGDITIQATDAVLINAAGIATFTDGIGHAGNLDLDAGDLTVREAGLVSTATTGSGRSGNLTLRVADAVLVTGSRPDGLLPSNLSSLTFTGTGAAGDLRVDARSIRLEQGGTIDAASGFVLKLGFLPSNGRGGDLTLHASESVEVMGDSIDTVNLSSILTTTYGAQDAGDLQINTRRLRIGDGGVISSATLGAGQGGDLTLNVSESIEIRGNGRIFEQVPSRIEAVSGDPFGIAPTIPLTAFTGRAGDLRVTTDRLILGDRGQLTVASIGSGRAGTIDLRANFIFLENQGEISASTTRGDEGNITINANQIFLQQGSRITTEGQHSMGGDITITTQGLFQDNSSDITAASQLGIDGTITLDAPEINPSRDFGSLPETPIDASQQIVEGCPADRGASFVQTGRGGLPEDPRQVLQGQMIEQDWRENLVDGTAQAPEVATPIAEAQGLQVDEHGKMVLIGQTPVGATPRGCPLARVSSEQ